MGAREATRGGAVGVTGSCAFCKAEGTYCRIPANAPYKRGGSIFMGFCCQPCFDRLFRPIRMKRGDGSDHIYQLIEMPDDEAAAALEAAKKK